MSSNEADLDEFTEARQSNSIASRIFPTDSTTSLSHKRRRTTEDADADTQPTTTKISDINIAKFRVLKKLNIQLTRTQHHLDYLQRCVSNKTIPKSLRVNIIPQERNFLNTCTKLPLTWWRYIDDIYMIWPHSREELDSFISGLNSYHDSIKTYWTSPQTRTATPTPLIPTHCLQRHPDRKDEWKPYSPCRDRDTIRTYKYHRGQYYCLTCYLDYNTTFITFTCFKYAILFFTCHVIRSLYLRHCTDHVTSLFIEYQQPLFMYFSRIICLTCHT